MKLNAKHTIHNLKRTTEATKLRRQLPGRTKEEGLLININSNTNTTNNSTNTDTTTTNNINSKS